MVLVRAERHLFASLPPAYASAQFIDAAMLSGANQRLVVTAARTDLGNVGNVIHAMRRVLCVWSTLCVGRYASDNARLLLRIQLQTTSPPTPRPMRRMARI